LDDAVTLADQFAASLLVLHIIPKDMETVATRSGLASTRPYSTVRSSYTSPQIGISFGQIDLREAARRELRQFLSDQIGKRAVEQRVEVGHPFEQILHTAEREPVDLIVMGTNGRTGLAHLVMGSVAERVVRLAPCPALTVKAPPDAD
jgi:nucleotide-binding universal stress UspA family protein